MKKYFGIVVLIVIIGSCIEPYDFDVFDTEKTIVIDASLTNEVKALYARISYAYALDKSTDKVLRSAKVWFEDNESIITPLAEIAPGFHAGSAGYCSS